VCKTCSGFGVLREVCDLILSKKWYTIRFDDVIEIKWFS
jgi:hypothetical protein